MCIVAVSLVVSGRDDCKQEGALLPKVVKRRLSLVVFSNLDYTDPTTLPRSDTCWARSVTAVADPDARCYPLRILAQIARWSRNFANWFRQMLLTEDGEYSRSVFQSEVNLARRGRQSCCSDFFLATYNVRRIFSAIV